MVRVSLPYHKIEPRPVGSSVTYDTDIDVSALLSDINNNMAHFQLQNLNADFRKTVDLLFFTDRIDVDFTNLPVLYANNNDHYNYLWSRLQLTKEIYWDEAFWLHRFTILLEWNPKNISKDLENNLISDFHKSFVWSHTNILDDNNEQLNLLLYWIKTKNSLKENLIPIKEFLLGLPNHTPITKTVSLIKNFIPYLFADMETYIKEVCANLSQSDRSFHIIQELEKQGFIVNKAPLFKMAKNLLEKRVPNAPNRRALLLLLNDKDTFSYLKKEYLPFYKDRLLTFLNKCEYKELEVLHFSNIKNLLALDESLADDLLLIYADKLDTRGTGQKKANIQRLVRVCKTFPIFSTKKLLSYLSSHNRMSDIKFLISAFPDLKLLAPFI